MHKPKSNSFRLEIYHHDVSGPCLTEYSTYRPSDEVIDTSIRQVMTDHEETDVNNIFVEITEFLSFKTF